MSDYFGEQIAQGKPIIPPNSDQAPSVPKAPVVQAEQTDAVKQAQLALEKAQTTLKEAKKASEAVDKSSLGLPVRGEGDRVFLLKGGKKYWITSSQVYNNLGFKFGDEVKLDEATLRVIPDGEPIR